MRLRARERDDDDEEVDEVLCEVLFEL